MPYRRLPNTDAARLRAMSIAKQRYEEAEGYGLPFNVHVINEINAFIPMFERAMNEYKTAFDGQVAKNQKYQSMVHQARMYVSHFIQVLNLACQRGEIAPEKKLMYKLLPDNYSVPDLSTEMLLLEWGKNVIDGETERMRSGGAPIYNPAIGRVKVYYDLFKDAYHNKKVSQKNTDRFLANIQSLRDKADEIILDLWNQVEAHFANLGVEAMQEEAKKYGIVYYLRRKERQALAVSSDSDSDWELDSANS